MEGKFLGIDYGTKRVGLATGEADFSMAFPRSVVDNKGAKDLVEKIMVLCDELGVDEIVVGLPLNIENNGGENRLMPQVEKFVALLKKSLDLKIHLFDERFSSYEADELMKMAHQAGDKVDIGRDAFAAQVILQRFFDKRD